MQLVAATFAVPTSLKPVLDAFDESHGRLTRRRVFVHAVLTELKVLEDWPGIKSMLAVESIRLVKPHGVITAEKRYFLSSVPVEEERQIAAIRQHWSIENSLHWVLDVTFQEDASRVRDQHARHNLAERAKNRHQSDPPQYDQWQCSQQTKTGRLE